MHSMQDLHGAESLKGLTVSVVIPTYNRSSLLIKCLQHIEAQTFKKVEVVVVDDGSTDDTQLQVQSFQRATKLRVKYFWQQNYGPARARNKAIAQLSSSICILIGDDTFPEPDFVQRHLNFHYSHPQVEAVAIGHTQWSEHGQVVTPLMRWLDSEGVQFAFRSLLEGSPPDWRHFYTSNLSAKTSYLQQNPFNETFANAGYEDTELGYRLFVKHGLKMFFLPEAITKHLHPTTFNQTCRRADSVGFAAHRFAELWPEHETRAPTGVKGKANSIMTESKVVLPIFSAFAQLVTRLYCPNALLTRAIYYHFMVGYNRASIKGN